jgi:glycerol kinase
MQIQSDVLQTPIIRPQNLEATATGVGLLALFSLGELSLKDIERLWLKDRVFSPSAKSKELDQNYSSWLNAVSQIPDTRSL